MAPSERTTSSTPDPREAIQEIVRAIVQNRVRVVFTTLVFLLMGVGITMIWPSKFASNTKFILREHRIVSDSSLLDDLGDIPLTRKLQAMESDLSSVKRIYSVMDELQWPEWLQTNSSPSRRRALYLKIKSNLDVEMNADVTGGIAVGIDFQWTSPAKAADFVNRLRDAWIKLVLEGYRRGVEAQKERAEAVVRERENDYTAALSARQKYEQENEVPSLLDVESNNGLKVELIVKIAEAKAKLEAAVTMIETLRVALAGIDKTIKVPIQLEDPDHAEAYADFLAAQEAHEDVRDTYKPAHPKHVGSLKELKASKAQLDDFGGAPVDAFEDETNPVYFEKAQQLEAAMDLELEHRTLATSLETRLIEVEENLERLPRVTMDMARLGGEVESTGELLTQSKQSVQPLRDQVRALRNANTNVGQDTAVISSNAFEILESGIEPELPVLPMGAIIMALSLLMGIGVGLAGPVLTKVTSGSFGTVKEVTRSLGVPVLGAVDLILTARDVRARSVQSALTITTMVLVLVALGTALYIYAAHKEVLPAKLLRALQDIELALT